MADRIILRQQTSLLSCLLHQFLNGILKILKSLDPIHRRIFMDIMKTIDLTRLYIQITNTVVFPIIHASDYFSFESNSFDENVYIKKTIHSFVKS